MNKDEALRCLAISKTKFADGHSDQAAKFARKSLALCETDEAKAWMEFLNKHGSNTNQNTNGTPSSNNSKQTNAPQKKTTSSSESINSESNTRPYTQDQVEGIKRIKAVKAKGDLYGILGLQKGCTESDIKKAYRKLALQFHPDKCGAPGTDDAFKAIGHAFAVLSDEGKREQYDRFGIDPESSGGRSAGGGGGGAFRHAGFGEEISPEDLFNMFFGDQFGGGRGGFHFQTNFGGPRLRRTNFSHRQHDSMDQRQQQRQRHQSANLAQYIQLIPLGLLLLFSLLSTFITPSDPSLKENSYSWERMESYTMRRETPLHKVPYYVNPTMYSTAYTNYPWKLKRFEDAIETQYNRNLQFRCTQEREYKNRMIASSQSLFFGVDAEKMKRAKAIPTASCDALQEWQRVSQAAYKAGRSK